MRASYSGGEPVCLRTILESVGRVKTKFLSDSGGEIYTCSCCSDPYQVKRGDVFFLLENDDLTFAPSDEEAVRLAQKRGCVAIVAAKSLSGIEVPFFVMSKAREAFGVLCHAIYGNPGKRLKLIGITGTSGKTTTSYLIAGVLAETGNRVGLIGSLGIYDGEAMYAPAINATPSPDLLAYWLFRMEMAGCTHAVIEVSSHALAAQGIAGIQWDAVCLTNIKQDHLDRHGSLTQYRRTKLAMFSHAKKEAIAILNSDDKVTSAILPLVENPTLTISLKGRADICAELVERHRSEQTFFVTAGSEAIPVRTTMIGNHHIENCLMAIGLSISMGNDLKTSVRGLERVESVPGRLERIECGQNFGVFVDCTLTPEGLVGSLQTLREVTRGRLVCLLGINAGDDASRWGRALSLVADKAILTVDSTQGIQTSEAAKWQVAEMVTAFDEGIEHHLFTDRATALATTLSQLDEDDCVLIVESHAFCAGNEPSSFCDKMFVKQWLYENQPVAAAATVSWS